MVLTGRGESWTAGMDLKEYFREVDAGPEIFQERIRRDARSWQWQLLRFYSKADHRDGQWLVLRRGVFPAGRL